MLFDIIRQTITEYNLLSKGDKVLVGLSGGADSVCLTHALKMLMNELEIEIFTAHVNHGIRGEEADSDEKFAVNFSLSLGIKCFVKKADIPAMAMKTGQSEEMAGRKVRYDFFEDICAENRIDKIATAHNKNDNAETIMMNFMRGSALGGLCGIPHKRGRIIRPILNASREEIEQYCRENKLDFVTDSTNLTDNYTRNKIRHILIPMIERNFNPKFISSLTANSEIFKQDSDFLEKYGEMAFENISKNNTVNIQQLISFEPALQRRAIRNMLKKLYGSLEDISSVYICDILVLAKNHSGTCISLPKGIIVKNEYGKLIFTDVTDNGSADFKYNIVVGETIEITEIKKKATVSVALSREKNDGAVYLDIGEAKTLVIRSKKSGDKFYPYGMNGSKKLKEYFINNKIPRDKRNQIPIIEINGDIAAVGNRVDKRFLFKDKGIKIEFYDI